jgi:hypothetical protein
MDDSNGSDGRRTLCLNGRTISAETFFTLAIFI